MCQWGERSKVFIGFWFVGVPGLLKDGRLHDLQEQLANQQEIEADSVNLSVRESDGLPCSCMCPMHCDFLMMIHD